MPEGTGIRRMQAATDSTIPQRTSLLLNSILSADSFSDLSEGSGDDCSTQSSFYWATQTSAGMLFPSRYLLKRFDSRSVRSDDDLACVSIRQTNRLIEVF